MAPSAPFALQLLAANSQSFFFINIHLTGSRRPKKHFSK